MVEGGGGAGGRGEKLDRYMRRINYAQNNIKNARLRRVFVFQVSLGLVIVYHQLLLF